MKKTINTIDGEKQLVKVVDDNELDQGDYSIANGFWVTHEGSTHGVYR